MSVIPEGVRVRRSPMPRWRRPSVTVAARGDRAVHRAPVRKIIGESGAVPAMVQAKPFGPPADPAPGEGHGDGAPPEGAQGAEKESKEPAGKRVCLTFDDGPQDGTADVLNALGGTIPATFFLTGKNMAPDKQEPLVERMLSEGHKIGNHTFSHVPMTKKGYVDTYGDLSDPKAVKRFEDNLIENETHFRKVLGVSDTVFNLARLPGDGRVASVGGKLIYVHQIEKLGMKHVGWQFEFVTNGVWPKRMKFTDWKGVSGVAGEVDRYPGASAIVLFHDRHWNGKQPVMEALLSYLAGAGYSFGQLDESGACSAAAGPKPEPAPAALPKSRPVPSVPERVPDAESRAEPVS